MIELRWLEIQSNSDKMPNAVALPGQMSHRYMVLQYRGKMEGDVKMKWTDAPIVDERNLNKDRVSDISLF